MTTDKAKEFLDPLYANNSPPINRPFVTLTFAQSLDGIIGKANKEVSISGKESLEMTHRLRTLHDAIMVGIGAALVDDPQLNARFIPEDRRHLQPQPVILDPRLELPLDCKLLRSYAAGKGLCPWVITASATNPESVQRQHELESRGVKVLRIQSEEGRLPLDKILDALWEQGIRSVMIEGGAKVIRSFLRSTFVDRIIITIAPRWLGEGIRSVDREQLQLLHPQYEQFGNDIVMAAVLDQPQV